MVVLRSISASKYTVVLSLILAVFAFHSSAVAEQAQPNSLAASTVTASPKNLADLQAMENKFKAVVEKVRPTVVGVQVGNARGSGVIVSEDGYVLTAGHVVGKPYQPVIFTFQDGKTAKGTTLGMFKSTDSGLMRITDAGKYPFAEKGRSADLQTGQWCLAMGHPLGYQPGRPPVVRVGRVLLIQDTVMQTDCPMINGDSGGPVFDLDGKVIGINSRIGGPTDQNLHVPVDVFTKNWDRLAKGDEWETKAPRRESAEVKTVFKEIVAGANPCVVRVKCDGRDTILGTVVGPDGWILTKNSEIVNEAGAPKGKITCRFRDGRELDAKIRGRSDLYDLAMLKVEADHLPIILWNNRPLAVGQWVASAGLTDEPASLGVVSVPRRPIPPVHGVMGIQLAMAEGPATIEKVMPLTPAEKAGIKPQDVVTEVNGEKVESAKDLQAYLAKCRVGDTVKLAVKRGGKALEFQVQLVKMIGSAAQQQEVMNSFGIGISKRAADFPLVSQHDSVLKPSDCGGPLVDLSGKVVGMNIAHAGRTETFAIPSDVLFEVMYQLMSGQLDPKLLAEKKAAEEKALAEKKAAEKKAADEKKAAEEKLAAEKKAAEEKAAAEKAAAEKLAAEKKAAEEKAAAEKLAAEKKAAEEKAAAEKAAAEKAAAEKKAADEKLAAEKAAAEKAAAEKAAAEKVAAEKAAAEKKAAEEKAAAEKAAAEKAAAEKAAAEKVAAEKVAAEKVAAEKVAAEKKAAEEKAAAEKAAAEKKAAEEKAAAEKAVQEKAAADQKAAEEKAAAEKKAAEEKKSAENQLPSSQTAPPPPPAPKD
jgi:S1-C subfamily serine protease